MAVTMVGLGIYLEVGDGSADLSWLPLLLILGYIVSTLHNGRRQGEGPPPWIVEKKLKLKGGGNLPNIIINRKFWEELIAYFP
jgi:hypothetical protein